MPAASQGLKDWAAKTLGKICAQHLEQFVREQALGGGFSPLEQRLMQFLLTHLAQALKEVASPNWGPRQPQLYGTLAWLLSPAFEEYCRPLGLDAKSILQKLDAHMRANRNQAIEWRREAIRRRLQQMEAGDGEFTIG